MSGLWRNRTGTREGKFLVMRRDGTIPEWPYFVIGARDPAAAAALVAYAHKAAELGMDHDYVDDILELSQEFEEYRQAHGDGDPDAPPHREDDPVTIDMMEEGRSA